MNVRKWERKESACEDRVSCVRSCPLHFFCQVSINPLPPLKKIMVESRGSGRHQSRRGSTAVMSFRGALRHTGAEESERIFTDAGKLMCSRVILACWISHLSVFSPISKLKRGDGSEMSTVATRVHPTLPRL